jgi:hypothetical protein
MPNNENYEKNPHTKLNDLLRDCGWQSSAGGWGKNGISLMVDTVGVFVFQWSGSRWVRTHGLAYKDMPRITHSREMVFSDGAKLNLEYGKFTPSPSRKKRRRR